MANSTSASSSQLEKVEGSLFTGNCPDCGKELYVFLTADSEIIPLARHENRPPKNEETSQQVDE